MTLSDEWWEQTTAEFQIFLVREFVRQANTGELDLSNYTEEGIEIVDYIQTVLTDFVNKAQ